MIVRRIIAVLVAVVSGAKIVRSVAVNEFAEWRPADASRLWSDHPATELSLAMTEIARAARAGRAVPASAFAMIADASVKEPLAPEPFLLRGVQAELPADAARAQRPFEPAHSLD